MNLFSMIQTCVVLCLVSLLVKCQEYAYALNRPPSHPIPDIIVTFCLSVSFLFGFCLSWVGTAIKSTCIWSSCMFLTLLLRLLSSPSFLPSPSLSSPPLNLAVPMVNSHKDTNKVIPLNQDLVSRHQVHMVNLLLAIHLKVDHR
jgi:hypothetical protein